MRTFVGVASLVAIATGCGRIGFAHDRELAGDAAPEASTVFGFRRITAYGDQTCADYNGQLHCWGRNASRQLGDGTQVDRPVPTPVALAGDLVAFTLGETHGCAVVDRNLMCWGEVTNSQVLMMPTVLASDATGVAAGKRFTCAVIGGKAQCWGVNDAGQLGDSSLAARDAIMPIADAQNVVEVDAGDDHACARTVNNTAVCWGHNDDGTLGSGAFSPTTIETPITVTGGMTTMPRIAGWHACTQRSGDLYCWGRNMEGALGDGTTLPKAAPQLVPNFPAAKLVATGGGPTDLDATCAITEADGDVYCWGAGNTGRLGIGSATNQVLPQRVMGLPAAAVDIALGYAHTCAVLANGEAWCWGRGQNGQLGTGLMGNALLPVKVIAPPGGA